MLRGTAMSCSEEDSPCALIDRPGVHVDLLCLQKPASEEWSWQNLQYFFWQRVVDAQINVD